MISFDEALTRVTGTLRPLPAQRLDPVAAVGLVAAEDVASPATVPPFDNSAMDGFALRAAETAGADRARPVILPVVGHTAAGPVGPESAPTGLGAWEIMTGAPVPVGFNAVVPVERTSQASLDDRPAVSLETPVEPGQNIRRAGEDFRAGDPVLHAGTRLGPEHLMALAATGVATLAVRPAPRVGIIATGAELVSDPGISLAPGQIRDSNNPYLQALLPRLGADVVYARTLGDDPVAFATALAELRECAPDVIITSGAVSAGVHDFIPAALRRAGAEIHFHKVAIRPGKPILFATLEDGTACFGLPGNPLSVAVGARFFVAAALRALQGAPPERWPRARLAEGWRKPSGMSFFGKGQVSCDADGQLQARMLPGQESFRIAPLTRANAWIVLPQGPAELAAGTSVAVAPLLPDALALQARPPV